jgi:hypothetical protein
MCAVPSSHNHMTPVHQIEARPVAAILYHKYKGRGGLLRNPQAQMAALYADAAYNGYGDIGALYRELIPCDTQGVKTWPNTVMPWKWVGVHLSADTE